MKSRNEIIADLVPKVRAIAHKTASYWPGTIDADDVEQEISLRLLELSDDALERLDQSPHAGVMSTLRMLGMQIASDYRNDYESFSGNYRYSGEEVRSLLESGALVFSDELTATERVDLMAAMERLQETSPQYAEALFRRYAEGIPDRGKSDENARLRAIRALTREMNRNFNRTTAEHEGPALRKGRC